MSRTDFDHPDYSLPEQLDLSAFAGKLAEVVREWVARKVLTSQEDVNALYDALVAARDFVDSPHEKTPREYRIEEARGRIKEFMRKAIGKSVDIYNDPPSMGVPTTVRMLLDCLNTDSKSENKEVM